MRAVILAGGQGTRLKPYTTVLPKPLMPIEGQSILEIIIRQIKSRGVDHITLAVNHMAEIIRAFAGDGSKWGLKIDYSMEDMPLGTVGPIRLIKDLPENFLVMNGDVLSDIDFEDLYQAHIKSGALLTIATFHRVVNIDFGVLVTNHEGRVTEFREKPNYEFDVSMGIYVFNKAILDIIPEKRIFGLDHLVLTMLDKKIPVNTYKYHGYWLDIGRPDDYDKANLEYESIKNKLFKE
ncbi:MAG: nucleotidyltransferase family protein [Candidatus Saccharibacteria bacterium]